MTLGYKQTEVGVIPKDWEVKSLAEICGMRSGKGITSASIDHFSEYPVYGGNGLRGYTDTSTHKGKFALVGRQGALCGNVYGVSGEFFASEHAVVVSSKVGVSIEWLTRVLARMELNRFSESSAQPGLAVQKILKLLVPVPAEETEQLAIAAALSDADAAVAGLERLIAKKRDLKQAAMQQLLTGQARLPGFSGEWSISPLSRLCEMKSGDGITSKSISNEGAFPCFGGNGLRGYAERFTHQGDYVLIGRVGALCGNILRASGKFFASEHAIVVTPRENISVDWLGLVLAKQNLNRLSESSAQPVLTVSKLLLLELEHPATFAEQCAIATVIADMEAELSALEAQLDKTRLIKQAMMQELLTGRTRLPVREAVDA